MRIAFLLIATLPMATLPIAQAREEGWWVRAPLRRVQTNLRETDANLDVASIMTQLTAM